MATPCQTTVETARQADVAENSLKYKAGGYNGLFLRSEIELKMGFREGKVKPKRYPALCAVAEAVCFEG